MQAMTRAQARQRLAAAALLGLAVACIGWGRNAAAQASVPEVSASGVSSGEEVLRSRLGLVLRPPQEGDSGADAGLRVDGVTGPAARLGVHVGDRLITVNATPVHDLAQVRELVAQSKTSLALVVLRGQRRIFIPMRLSPGSTEDPATAPP